MHPIKVLAFDSGCTALYPQGGVMRSPLAEGSPSAISKDLQTLRHRSLRRLLTRRTKRRKPPGRSHNRDGAFPSGLCQTT